MNYGFIGAAIFLLIILYLVIWIFIKPFKMLVKVILNGLVGSACMLGFNFVFAKFGVWIGINVGSALVCGVLGMPGFAMLGASSFFLS